MSTSVASEEKAADAGRAVCAAWLAALALFFLGVSPSAQAQIRLVHVTSCGATAFPASCTVPATGAGNLIVIGWNAGQPPGDTSAISVTDDAGNTYAEAGGANASGSPAWLDIRYAKNSMPGATSVTVNAGASVPNAAVVIWEFAGADPAAPLDATAAQSSQSSSGTAASPSVTTTTANEVVIAIAGVAGQTAGMVTGNPFTNDASSSNHGFAHLIASEAGTYSAQWIQTPPGAYASSAVSFRAQAATSSTPCDLNGDGITNSADVALALNMALGTAPCSANVEGPLTCTVLTLQRVTNASLGQACIAYGSHAVILNWVASVTPMVNYNVYRATSDGPYQKLNSSPISGTTYTDTAVQAGETYYYVATAVDANQNESAYSSPPVKVVIPTP